ncbi:MAG: hypothetical protein R3B91_01150 [Planctomycetaceae bacterium]
MSKAPIVIAIDDDRSVLMLVERALGEEGYEVATYETASEGLAAIGPATGCCAAGHYASGNKWPGAVFFDSRDRCEVAPVVFITATADSETAIDAIQLGGFDYIPKPLDLAHLRTVTARAIKTRQLMSVPVALSS